MLYYTGAKNNATKLRQKGTETRNFKWQSYKKNFWKAADIVNSPIIAHPTLELHCW